MTHTSDRLARRSALIISYKGTTELIIASTRMFD